MSIMRGNSGFPTHLVWSQASVLNGRILSTKDGGREGRENSDPSDSSRTVMIIIPYVRVT